MKILHSLRIAAALLIACSSAFANAGLLGTTVSQCTNSVYSGVVTIDTSQCNNGTPATPNAAVVGAATEFQLGTNRFFDFGDNSLEVRYVDQQGSASPDLLIFTFQDPLPGITLVGSNSLDITWLLSGNRLGILINQPLGSGVVTFEFDGRQVPEPGSIALVGLGLFGLARSRRKRVSAT